MRVVVAEAQKAMRQVIVSHLEQKDFPVAKASDLESLELQLNTEADLLILDASLLVDDLKSFLMGLRKKYPIMPVLLTSYREDFENEIDLSSFAPLEILVKPFPEDTLDKAVERALFPASARQAALQDKSKIYLDLESLPSVKRHPLMKKAVGLIRNVAQSDITVLISGESGVGKEVFARALHQLSQRKQDRFVGLNCASVPSELLEAELFGAERGAYTGSVNRRVGKFEMAQKGTLLLDEVSEMDVNLQAKLLRVIQEKELYRVGGEKRISLDVRIVATTNRDLRSWVAKGNFREDLYYRLNVISVQIPPIRERLEDVPILASFIVSRFNHDNPDRKVTLSSQAIEQLTRYSWPGNIRELENVLMRSIFMASDNKVTQIQFDDSFKPISMSPISEDPISVRVAASSQSDMSGDKIETIEEMERQMIFRALELNSGNRVHAANALGISVRTLRNKLRLYQEEGYEESGAKVNPNFN